MLPIPGAWRIKQTVNRGARRAIVLMYHRVANISRDPWGINVKPDHFNAHLYILKKYGTCITASKLANSIYSFSLGKETFVITFDDGYVDNYTEAKPLLENHDLPATFYIVSQGIGKKEEFWWDKLENIIFDNHLPNTLNMTVGLTSYIWQIDNNLSNQPRYTKFEFHQQGVLLYKDQLYYALWEILSHLNRLDKDKYLSFLKVWAKASNQARENYLPMNIKELIDLSKSSLFEIGAHTQFHPFLARIPLNEQEAEIANSKNDLESIINQPLSSFSFPHGSYSKDTLTLLKKYKFNNACTVKERAVNQLDSSYELPRYMVFDWDGDTFEKKLKQWLTA